MKKILIIILLVIVGIIALIVLTGMYKFNVLEDDIYIKTESGDVVKYNELSEEQKQYQYDEDGLPPRESTAEVFEINCQGEVIGSMVYGVIPEAVLISIDGETDTLFATTSGSGVRYANESTVVHEKEGEVLVQQNDQLLFGGCILENSNQDQ